MNNPMTNEPGQAEAHYGGIDFRSSAQARWARFFDVLGVGWSWEHEQYDVTGDGTAFLPDFWIPPRGYGLGTADRGIEPGVPMWVVTSENEPTYDLIEKCSTLATGRREPVFLFDGDPLENRGIFFGDDHSDGGGCAIEPEWSISAFRDGQDCHHIYFVSDDLRSDRRYSPRGSGVILSRVINRDHANYLIEDTDLVARAARASKAPQLYRMDTQ